MSKTPINRDMQAKVFQRDGFRCRYCGDLNGPFEIDHVYPESKGGQTILENFAVACRSCNRIKQDNIGLWPFPVGYFETQDKPIPIGDGRYWNFINLAIKEIERIIQIYKEADIIYIMIARSMLSNPKIKSTSTMVLCGHVFSDYSGSTEATIDRLKYLHSSLSNIFPRSKIKSFLLLITGQQPPMIDLQAALVAVNQLVQNTNELISEVSISNESIEDEPVDEALFNGFYYPISQTIKGFRSCLNSLELIEILLHNAQLSLG